MNLLVFTILKLCLEFSHLSFDKPNFGKLSRNKNSYSKFNKNNIDSMDISARPNMSKTYLKWRFVFKELRKTLTIFMDQRKNIPNSKVYEDFCQAVLLLT